MQPPVPKPRYDGGSLLAVVPSLLHALGVPGFEDQLRLHGPANRVVLLMVDGLGWELLQGNRETAPFLSSIAREPISSGFPATTAVSLSMVLTGVPPGQSGMVGYTIPLPAYDRALNLLTWSLYGLGGRTDLRDRVVPEAFQPLPTLGERAAAAGVQIRHIGPPSHEGSGLTRAIGRGERFHPAASLEEVCGTALDFLHSGARFVYGYHPALDAAGHVYGVTSHAWRTELTTVDGTVRTLAEQLPGGTLLLVTGDHGMVDVRQDERLDLADHAELAAGVDLLAGEARARFIKTVVGAANDVLQAWRSRLGDRMWVWTTEEAIALGLFGPQVTDVARHRMGDIVAAAFGRVGVVQRDVDPAQARLQGHHGSLTAHERLVPLLVYRP